jgi:hypothetical protein
MISLPLGMLAIHAAIRRMDAPAAADIANTPGPADEARREGDHSAMRLPGTYARREPTPTNPSSFTAINAAFRH